MYLKELAQSVVMACILADLATAEYERINVRSRSSRQAMTPPGPFCVDIVFVVQNSCTVEEILPAVKYSITVLADILGKEGDTKIALLTYNAKAKVQIPTMLATEFLEAFNKFNLTNAPKKSGACKEIIQADTTDALAMIDKDMTKYFPEASNVFSSPRGKLIILYTDGVTFTSKFDMEENEAKVAAMINSLQSNGVTFAPIDIDISPAVKGGKKTEFHLYTNTLATKEFSITEYFIHQFITSLFRKYHCPLNTA